MQRPRELIPPDRDRLMQVHLAQARGPVRNGDLLRTGVRRALSMLAARKGRSVGDDPLIQTLAAVTDALEAMSIPCAITGSIASSIHGEPFSSVDVDLIVVADARQAEDLARRLSPQFYAPADTFVQSCAGGGPVNVIDNHTSMKADLSFVGSDPLLLSAIRRRVRLPIGGDPGIFLFVSPEDVILMKLAGRKDTLGQAVGKRAERRPRKRRSNGLEIPLRPGPGVWN